MRRIFILISVIITLLSLTMAEDIIFREGTYWIYETESGDRYKILISVVGAPSEFTRAGYELSGEFVTASLVNFYNEEGDISDSGFLLLSGDGSIWMDDMMGNCWMVYKKGLPVGYTWRAEMEEGFVGRFRVDGYESISTPAGKFNGACKVVVDIYEGGGDKSEGSMTYWFADGVGMVKSINDFGSSSEVSELVDYGD